MEKNLKGYFIELLIVVIGVSIAFWLSQIAEEKREDTVRKRYMADIQLDLTNDIRLLDQVIELNTKKQMRTYEVANLFADADANKDAIIEQSINIGNYNFFNPKDFTYKSMIASGDFKLIKDGVIKRELIRLHSRYKEIDNIQINFLQALDDNFFPFLMTNFDYTNMQPTNPDFHKSMTIKNFFMFTVNDLNNHLNSYEYAKQSALKLDSLISVELK